MYELVDILTSERLRLVSDWREITSAELLPGRAIRLISRGADQERNGGSDVIMKPVVVVFEDIPAGFDRPVLPIVCYGVSVTDCRNAVASMKNAGHRLREIGRESLIGVDAAVGLVTESYRREVRTEEAIL